MDAGRLFLVDSIPKFTKDASAPVLRLFTQVNTSFFIYVYIIAMSKVLMQYGKHGNVQNF